MYLRFLQLLYSRSIQFFYHQLHTAWKNIAESIDWKYNILRTFNIIRVTPLWFWKWEEYSCFSHENHMFNFCVSRDSELVEGEKYLNFCCGLNLYANQEFWKHCISHLQRKYVRLGHSGLVNIISSSLFIITLTFELLTLGTKSSEK
jgi:hypothetical protein